MNSTYEDRLKDEIDLRDIFITVFNYKYTVISVCVFAAVLSALIAINIPNTYSSQALLAPTSDEESLSSQLSSLSSLPSISGLNIMGEEASKSTEAIARMQSYNFFVTQFLPNIELQDLMAVKRWNPEKNNLIYSSSIYDDKNKKWSKEFLSPRLNTPSKQKAFQKYQDILTISEDRKTSFVTISLKHKSPLIAKEWLDIVVNNINEIMREEDIKRSQNSIDFLNESFQTTNIQSIKDAISNLQEAQMKTLMLASSSESYVFKILDEPIVPEKKSEPSRSIIVVLGTLFGGILSLLLILLNRIYRFY